MLLAWLPYLVALYPGVVWWDTSHQMWQYLVMAQGGGFEQFTDHHPLFDTMLYGSALQFGDAFLGGDRRGLFLLVLAQSYTTAFAFSLSCLFVRRLLHCRRAWCIAMFAFFSICPLFPIWCASVVKDTLFSCVFLLWVLGAAYLAIRKGRFPCASMLVAFCVVTLLACLTKKTGMYIVLPTLALMAFAYRKQAPYQIAVPLVLGAATMLVVMPLVIASFGMTAGGKQEMLAVPLNQTARVAAYHADDIAPGERAAIDGLLGYDTLADRYNPIHADPVKGFQELGTDEAYLAWFETYLCQGIRHPLTYADAFLALESGWFSFAPGSVMWFESSHHKAETEAYVSEGFFERSDEGALRARAVADVYGAMSAIPLVNLVTTRAVWAAAIPAVFFVVALRARRKRQAMLLFTPVALSFALLMVSPVSDPSVMEASRYALPFLYCGPVWLMLSLHLIESDACASRAQKRATPEKRPLDRRFGTSDDSMLYFSEHMTKTRLTASCDR